MEATNQPKGNRETPQNIVNKEQLKSFQENTKKYREITKKIFQNKQSDKKLFTIVAFAALAFFWYSAFHLYTQVQNLNKQSGDLDKINKYDVQILKANKSTQSIISSSTSIEDLLKGNDDLKKETQRYKKYKENLQLSYTYFLQYIILPKLNIRKELYTDKLKTDLLGKNFLDKNPYNDINLFQKWTDFFSSTDKNQVNDIKNVEIWDVTDNGSGLFFIPISFSFTAPSKSALLILTDKLTETSDKDNISLLGEFFYYLRQQIKTDKKNSIETIKKQTGLSWDDTLTDKVIWYSLYNRIFTDKEYDLVDDAIINKTIIAMMECKPDTEIQCYYKFRDKYRNISQLAYTLGIANNTHKTSDLRAFLKNLPPLIAIQNFTYNKIQDQSILQQQNTKYQGEVKLQIYGQSVSEEDKNEIALKLGQECLWENNKPLSVEEATSTIQDAMRKSDTLSENGGDNNNSSNISDLKKIIDTITTEYDTLNNYKKTIRLFEIYRMLNESWLCKTI